jgi:hypothetical protein
MPLAATPRERQRCSYFSYRPEWWTAEASPDYAKLKGGSIIPTALTYRQSPRASSINCACRGTGH